MSFRSILLSLALGVSCGCSSSEVYRAEGFDPRVPLRVGVLPFVDQAEGDSLASKPLVTLLDVLPFLGDDQLTKENAATIARFKLQGNLYKTHLDVLNLHVVDSLLSHREIKALELYEVDRADAARKLGDVLGVDAVMFGWVTEWDRDYYLVESKLSVGLKVEMRDTVSGEVLFTREVHDTELSGVTKVPLVYSPDGAAQAIVLEPIKGLQGSRFLVLSDDVARQVVDGLAPPAEERAAAKAPRIRFVAHDANAPLQIEDELSVFALGDADCRATFQIGARGDPYPMTETSAGVYRGGLRVTSGHTVKEDTVTVRLVSRELRASTMTVKKPAAAARN